MIKLVVSNQKGGVAKTTTTHTLARYMADRGKRVLLIDTDSQGSLAVALGTKFTHNLHDMVINGRALEDTVTHVFQQGDGTGLVDLVCSDRNTVETEATLMGRIGREFTFRTMFAAVELPYDVVIFDVAPSITLLQTCAMVYAERLLIPVAMDVLSLQGVGAALETAKQLNNIFQTSIKGVAFLPVMVERQLQMTKMVLSNLQRISDSTGIPVLPGTRRDVTVGKAMRSRLFLAEHAPGSRIMEDYTAAFDTLMPLLEKDAANGRAQGA